MAVELNRLMRGVNTALASSYEDLLYRAQYHMKLQSGGEQGFRLYLKGLYPLLSVRSAADFNMLLDGEVSDDYYLLADKASKANEHPTQRTLMRICLACRIPVLPTIKLFRLAGRPIDDNSISDKAFLAVICLRERCSLKTKFQLIEDLKTL